MGCATRDPFFLARAEPCLRRITVLPSRPTVLLQHPKHLLLCALPQYRPPHLQGYTKQVPFGTIPESPQNVQYHTKRLFFIYVCNDSKLLLSCIYIMTPMSSNYHFHRYDPPHNYFCDFVTFISALKPSKDLCLSTPCYIITPSVLLLLHWRLLI